MGIDVMEYQRRVLHNIIENSPKDRETLVYIC